jgi:hypothetical protein
MASLSDPTFQVDILTGMPNDYRVTATVTLVLDPFETLLVNAGLPLELRSNIWGDDGPSTRDHLLFSFTTQNITAAGPYSFSAIIPRDRLNEDDGRFINREDEVYSKFNLVSRTNFFSINLETDSPIITGLFG